MIGTVENKLYTTCYRTEFTYDKSFVVNRIMVEDVIMLKITRVGYKVVINSIIADLDRRILYDCIQIYRLQISCAWICFIHHDLLC